ncbi:MAG TPA: S-methyl-5-thioribose-1-phosphate isomerase [Gemmatimonadaceae bacterium]|nr:S-methyl-5-thioribose-1-phosphate isomerase [Gemmatimonadaceae bacterium]
MTATRASRAPAVRRYVWDVPLIQAVRWSPEGDAVRIIDQRLLPSRFEERDLRTLEEVCAGITQLAVRGAPAIGIAASMGLVASLAPHADESPPRFLARMRAHAERLRATRPTAVNLSWAMDRMEARAAEAIGSGLGSALVLEALRHEATAILEEDRAMCRRIGEHALALIPDGARVLTHCNAGALATGGIGTALAPLYLAAEAGRQVDVLVGETRPLLQGARLTAWELSCAGIPVRVVADGAVASVMREGRVDLAIVGADRIAANGDVANKIGTYSLAVAAHHHGVPLYVAAPSSSVDPALASGTDIAIEQRSRDEIARDGERTVVPDAAVVENPAFDVTPAALVSAIVTERGVHEPPFDFRST